MAQQQAFQLEEQTELVVGDYPAFVDHLVDHYGFTTEEVAALWASTEKRTFVFEQTDGSWKEYEVGMVTMIGPAGEGQMRKAFLVQKSLNGNYD